jgi:hypothetical protein
MAVYGGPDIVTDGLALNLDAGNNKSYPGAGNTWYDLSGHNRHFTWSGTPTHNSIGTPYFSLLGLTCTGPASNSFGITDAGGYTIFLAFLQNSLNNYYSFNFTGSGTYGRGIFSHVTWGNENVYFDQGGCCNADTRINGKFNDTTTKWSFAIYRRKDSERKLYQNLRSVASTTTAAANLNFNSSAARVVDNTSWNAKMGLFIVYNRGLEDVEVDQNYNALKGRFGL